MNNELLSLLYAEYSNRNEWETTPEAAAAGKALYKILNAIRGKLTVEEFLDLEEAALEYAATEQREGCINGLRLGARLSCELAGLSLEQ